MNNGYELFLLGLLSTQRNLEYEKCQNWIDKANELLIKAKYANTIKEKQYYFELYDIYKNKIDAFIEQENKEEEIRKKNQKVGLVFWTITMIGLIISLIIGMCHIMRY